MLKILFPIMLLISSLSIRAQIASASLFRQMRSQNPAVILKRPAATLSFAIKKDLVEKNQEVSGSSISSSTSDIDITTTSFFYGGKGKVFNVEIQGELSSGEKVDKVSTAGASENVTNKADMTVLGASFGFLKYLGIGYTTVSEDRTQSGSSTGSYETTLDGFTIGTSFNLGLDVGVFYSATTFKSIGVFAGSATNQELDMPRIGIGLGRRGKAFHFELGYVKDLNDISEDQGGGSGSGSNTVSYSPSKYVATFEFKLKGLMLGITSNYYMDGFFDFNNLMYYTMVLSANKENRLENTFNFSLGGEKGHSFSGSVSYSTVESEELPPTLSSGVKYKTTSKIMGAQVSYTYNF